MKTVNTNNKLAFAKNSLVELNDNQLNDVNGGGTPVIIVSIIITVLIPSEAH
ncbi:MULTISPECIES: class IIb bacteriocin, lactobin A/cerein 7B family [Flavobacterium]|uniref:class IIb bacteriocin, lactobin A/cerein 7B family n=1 Tax=Flavobacterium TaxID=237 RepID=UPI0015B2EB9B|nr:MULTISPECIES: class IIb bacteriocin, lactobin A/cerein 7B family [Flavobacterium]MBN9283346.1 class IIb bacteriocin, lactobin A/cerein 7B family [Flavobacterium sp.]